MTEDKNPFEYQYKPNDVVEIPANALLNFMHFLGKVIDSQPKMAVPYAYAKDVKIKKDADGNTTNVVTDWQPYDNLETFLKTIENPVPIATEITILAEQIYYKLNQIQNENIEKGIAKKLGTLTVEKDATSILDKPNKKKA